MAADFKRLLLKLRINLALFSQEFENGGPPFARNFRGRHRQSLARPRVGGDAGGGVLGITKERHFG
jgi:hypothetical protein